MNDGCIIVLVRTFHTVSRWSGPGIRLQKQEKIEMREPRELGEEANPGRSARSRYAREW